METCSKILELCSFVVGVGCSCSVFWEVEAQVGGLRSASFPRERQSSAGNPGQGGSF